MYKTYIISLHQPDKLINQLKKYELDPILIKGVNGKELDKETIKNNTNLVFSYIGPKSAIGIGMSHIKVWKEFLKTDAKYAIVFEDDVVFVPNFKQKLDNIIKYIPIDYDILYLGCFGCNTKINMFTYLGSMVGLININNQKVNKFVNKPAIALATHAYIISRTGAGKLIHYIENNIFHHIDYQINTLIVNNKINAYSLNDRLVYQTSTDETQSTNSINHHPILIHKLLGNYYIDKKVKANYLTSVSIVNIFNINITLISILFILLGILLGSTDINLVIVTLFYLLLSSPDLYLNLNNSNILIHYIFLIVPFLIIKKYKNDK